MKSLVEAEELLGHNIVVCEAPWVDLPIFPKINPREFHSAEDFAHITFTVERILRSKPDLLLMLEDGRSYLLAYAEQKNIFVAWEQTFSEQQKWGSRRIG
jgi:hypothetical protein